MKKRKNGYRFKARTYYRPSRARIDEMEPEDFAAYVRQAEKAALKNIVEMQLGPAAALFLLAQQTQVIIMGDPRTTMESSMAIVMSVLSLWQDGYYTPGTRYPYTLEETVQELQGGPKAKGDYTELFRRFIPTSGDVPHGIGTIYGGIVQHPETKLWQIWIMDDGPFTCIAAYHDPVQAQHNLETIINACRKGGSWAEGSALYKWMQAQSDSEPRQIPYDMIVFLVEHLDQYVIEL